MAEKGLLYSKCITELLCTFFMCRFNFLIGPKLSQPLKGHKQHGAKLQIFSCAILSTKPKVCLHPYSIFSQGAEIDSEILSIRGHLTSLEQEEQQGQRS